MTMPSRNRFQRIHKSRNRRLWAECLETRALLTTFYVDADLGAASNDGSVDAPFVSIMQGVGAALSNPGEDEVVVIPRAADDVYDETVALSNLQATDFSPIVLRGATGEAGDVVLSSSSGPAILIDVDIDMTIRDLRIQNQLDAGIRIIGNSTVNVDNVQIVGSQRNSGIVHQNGNLTVRHSYLANNYQGLWSAELRDGLNNVIAKPGNLTVEDTILTNNAAQGLLTRYSTGDVVLNGVNAIGNQLNGLRVSQTESLAVNGGEFSDNGRSGISIQDSSSLTFDSVHASGNNDNGFWGLNVSDLTIAHSTLNSNSKTGIYLDSSAGPVIVDTTISNNLWRGVKLINANGALIDGVIAEDNGDINGTDTGGGGGIGILPSTAVPIVITNSQIRRNETRGNGGGIEVWANQEVNRAFTSNVTISNTIVEENKIAPDVYRHGGGIALFGTVRTDLQHVQVRNNVARGTAGVHYYTTFAAPEGFPSTTVSDSTISGNVALPDGPGIGAGAAGLYHGAGYLVMSNTTISGNNGGNAGGLYMASFGGSIASSTISGNFGDIVGGVNSQVGRESMTFRNVTIVNNRGNQVGGLKSISSVTSLGNTIVAGNELAENLTHGPIPSDLSGTISTVGGNFFGEASYVQISLSGGSDQRGTVQSPLDPKLGSLQDNGGPTLTHAPLAGSPVINTGLNSLVSSTTDQRGVGRIQDGVVDIGAVELSVFNVTVDSSQNRINLNTLDKSKKSILLVMQTTNVFNAATVSISTVVWAGASPVTSYLDDVDGDGDLDLVLEFLLRDTDLIDRYRDAMRVDSSNNAMALDISLQALTNSGNKVIGASSVDVVMTGKALRDLLRLI